MKKELAIIPTGNDWATMKDQAAVIVRSGLLPKAINTPEKVLTLALTGRSLGLDMMESVRGIWVLDGRPELNGDLMLRLIRERCPQAKIKWIERSGNACVIQTQRPSQDQEEFSFTREDATKADLMGKTSWQKYTRAMLQWRCVSEMARTEYSDILFGCYAEGETRDSMGGGPEEVEVLPTRETVVVEEIEQREADIEKFDPVTGEILVRDITDAELKSIMQLKEDWAIDLKWRDICQAAIGYTVANRRYKLDEFEKIYVYLREIRDNKLDQG